MVCVFVIKANKLGTFLENWNWKYVTLKNSKWMKADAPGVTNFLIY